MITHVLGRRVATEISDGLNVAAIVRCSIFEGHVCIHTHERPLYFDEVDYIDLLLAEMTQADRGAIKSRTLGDWVEYERVTEAPIRTRPDTSIRGRLSRFFGG